MDDARQVHSGLMQLYAIVNQRKQFINSLGLVSDEKAAHDISLLFDIYQEVESTNTADELARQKIMAGDNTHVEDNNTIINRATVNSINKLVKPEMNKKGELDQMQGAVADELEELSKRLDKLNIDL